MWQTSQRSHVLYGKCETRVILLMCSILTACPAIAWVLTAGPGHLEQVCAVHCIRYNAMVTGYVCLHGHWVCVYPVSPDPLFAIGGFPLPKMWVYLLGNCVTQYVCIRGVFVLTTECPSLVVTLVITLRKFVSLLFSIFYFNNSFTSYHWVATAMVFSGTGLFTGLLDPLINLVLHRTEKQD